jgi:hypothetical protein
MKAGLIILGGALILTGCVRYVETHTDSVGISLINPAGYLLVTPEKVVSPELSKAQEIVAQRLSAKGYAAAENGTMYLQVGTAIRPASLSLSKPAGILAKADKKRGSSKCVWNEYRVVIVLTTISDGTEMYHGSASEYHCKESLTETLPILIDAALADLGNPRGAVTTKRRLN